jgi:hypothetical protein
MRPADDTLGAALERLAQSGPDERNLICAIEHLGALVLEGTVTGVEHGAGQLATLLESYPAGSLAGQNFVPWLEARIAADRGSLVAEVAGATPDEDGIPDRPTVERLLARRDGLAALEMGASLFEVESWEHEDAMSEADDLLGEWAEGLA